jgi:uncharacterized protein with GYD domain
MPTYISLLSWTQKGVENVRASPSRLDAARKIYKEMGGEIKGFYLVMGRYDSIVIGEAPDDETAAKIALAIGALGSVRTETLRAFTEDEYRKIISAIP